MKKTIRRMDLPNYVDKESNKFPKFVSGVINTANRYGHGTDAEIVGQMSEEFKKFRETTDNPTFDNWTKWYMENHSDAIAKATAADTKKFEEIRAAISEVKKENIEEWVRDLVLTKTFNGLYLQNEILTHLAKETGQKFRESTKDEESKGIDGYIGDVPYSVKPESYRRMKHLKEDIKVTMIYYKFNKDRLEYEVIE